MSLELQRKSIENRQLFAEAAISWGTQAFCQNIWQDYIAPLHYKTQDRQMPLKCAKRSANEGSLSLKDKRI
ncbi:MAG: hypothetical protein EBW38_20450 [Rhodobacteraceae bacterium]|nr:hypothetical protein [Paracoccaceae bacterium]